MEEVNDKVVAGIPFREAYRQVGMKIQAGEYEGDIHRPLYHTHEGSIGNLCLEQIRQKFNRRKAMWNICKIREAEEALIEEL